MSLPRLRTGGVPGAHESTTVSAAPPGRWPIPPGWTHARAGGDVRAFRRIVLAVVALLLSATLARAAGTIPAGYNVAAESQLYTGVVHEILNSPSPSEEVHVARIAPDAPVVLRTVSSHDVVSHSEADQELPSDMCRRVSCIAGINGDFHDGEPLGGVASGGRLVKSP